MQQNSNRPPFISLVLTTLTWVFLACVPPATASDLPPAVHAALKAANIPLSDVSLVVRGVDESPPVLELNSRQAMNPASTMKLVTTYAALELLGPAFTWKTEALSERPPLNGTLTGNLYLRGSGDPKLLLEQFWLLLRELRNHGVRDVAGDLVLDRGAFSLPPHDPAAFDQQPLRPYNAGPDALLVNLKSISLRLNAAPGRKAVDVVSETPSDSLSIDNRLLPSEGPCGDWRERIQTDVAGSRLTLSGHYPLACGERWINLAPWSADEQVEQLFRALWKELGGTLTGKVRSGPTPDAAQALTTHASPTLGEIVRDINKYSNNVMARQVFLALDNNSPATTNGARQRVTAWLAEKALDLPGLELDNGSGLSRSERISADGMSRLLLAAWKSPVMPELLASLPLAGVDGTMRKRLGNTAAAGRAHLKTGYLGGVRAIAGYVQDSADRRWIVVFLINGPRAGLGKPAMDALLSWVADR